MTLATQVLIGLLLGIAVGIFFGEEASVLDPVGTAALYDYWILGKEVEAKEPRWSVIRNVLHWIE